jgi:hypothetical protein
MENPRQLARRRFISGLPRSEDAYVKVALAIGLLATTGVVYAACVF